MAKTGGGGPKTGGTGPKRIAKKAKAKSKKVEKRPKAKKSKTKRKPSAQLIRNVSIDSVLQPIVGSIPLPRTEVTKRVWAYIKANGLQDSKERRNINADSVLKKVFGGKSKVNMFEMTKLISKHLK